MSLLSEYWLLYLILYIVSILFAKLVMAATAGKEPVIHWLFSFYFAVAYGLLKLVWVVFWYLTFGLIIGVIWGIFSSSSMPSWKTYVVKPYQNYSAPNNNEEE